jgi:2'-5' RNA ligase
MAFLGKVPGARVGLVQQAMGSAAGAGFELVLDQLRLRKRGGMVWARAGGVPSALAQLVTRLRHALAACEFAVEDRAFVPHITLLRDVRACVPLPDFVPLAWSIDAMALVRSELARDGAHYETLFQVPLAG